MNNLLNILPNLIEILGYGMALWGFIRHIIVSRTMKKQNQSKIIPKKTAKQLRKANQLILAGFTIAFTVRIISIIISM